MPFSSRKMVAAVSTKRLAEYVRGLEGVRHGWENPALLEEKAQLVEATLRAFGLKVESQEVPYRGRSYRNLIVTLKGSRPELPWLLLGAHYDASWGAPGADDNASGVAVLLETARLLSRWRPTRTVQLVAFTLEELQGLTTKILIGSAHFVREAKRAGRRYQAALILECVGYTDPAEGSQRTPPLVNIRVPSRGDFLGVVANRRSRRIMKEFCSAAGEYAPGLRVVPYQVPLSGLFVPEARFSDHASFWDHGYPALMLTDTAMFRNPHYHLPSDTAATLDFAFMADVTRAAIGTLVSLGAAGP